MNRRRLRCALVICLLTATTAIGAYSQTRAAVATETVYVTITTRDGNLVSDLKNIHFEVHSKNDRLNLLSIVRVDDPISVGILLDVSGSMGFLAKSSDLIKQELGRFLYRSNDRNEYSVIRFAEDVELTLEKTQDWNSVLDSLPSAEVTRKGNTDLFGAIAAGCEVLVSSQLSRKALIIFSDGQNTSETHQKWRDVRTKAEESDVQIYFIALRDRKHDNAVAWLESAAAMDELAELTGGQVFYLRYNEDLQMVLRYIAENLRSQFKVEISTDIHSSKSRSIKLKIDAVDRLSKDKKLYKVRTRTRIKL